MQSHRRWPGWPVAIAAVTALTLWGGTAVANKIAVRYLDDAGKVAGMATPDFWHFAPMVQQLVDQHCAAGAA